MLTEIDPRVLAATNLRAVLGSLPRLAELVPAARDILRQVPKPTTLTFVVPGLDPVRYTFTDQAITAADAGGRGPTLLFRSAAHANAVIAGSAQPIPLAGPAGIRFLTKVFTPLSDLLGRYLQPSDADLADPAFRRLSTLMTLDVAARAIAVVGNEDVSGRFSAAHMPDGDLDLEFGDEVRYRLEIKNHRVRLDDDLSGTPRAILRFADLDVAGGVITGRDSALACVCDGRLAMRGFIPLVDNTSRILDRVGAYLGA
ncbi:hypothetical protein LQ938_01855 [Microbacterium sp. cx-55]|uniref:hypothetical protein n=1 Tax=unclassified Microbacterium TaxID=2609290 RepID=UPI001CBBB270|nr:MULTISPECIES: hypothetical protein [unclassified Microbacterium]MBZ4487549.1 hypothetical protein [Microbacterium sp. cx-55]MCC4908302.1 hypothetical protein [Microbacterium sp. cx-59]UGB35569.1 hypothetical protein LQ938_01855 [Microbacterium sp. cx-55]